MSSSSSSSSSSSTFSHRNESIAKISKAFGQLLCAGQNIGDHEWGISYPSNMKAFHPALRWFKLKLANFTLRESYIRFGTLPNTILLSPIINERTFDDLLGSSERIRLVISPL